MRRTLGTWAACLVVGCGGGGSMAVDAFAVDGGADAAEADAAETDAAAIDAAGLDAGEDEDASTVDDGGVEVDGGSDAGDFEGHIVRLANVHNTTMNVELCLYLDGIASPPVRMMEELGRAGGLAHLEVSARYAIVPLRASVPVRVVDVADGDCETPIFETAITGVRNHILFVLATSSFIAEEDDIPAPAATDIWRHLHHDGGSGVFALIHDDGAVQRPTYYYGDVSGSGTLTYRNFDDDLIFSRSFTAVPGGAFTTFSLQPGFSEVEILICDDRAPAIDGLTECGATVRP